MTDRFPFLPSEIAASHFVDQVSLVLVRCLGPARLQKAASLKFAFDVQQRQNGVFAAA
jgi:hypothetical protein